MRQPDQLDALLSNGDLNSAGRLLHTLKGLSSTVGATHMAAVARLAESAIKGADGTTPLDALRSSFRDSVASTAQALGPLVGEYAAAAMPVARVRNTAVLGTKDKTALLADLGELHALLACSDLRALEVHARVHRACSRAAINGYEQLDLAVGAFDFANGLVLCEQLMETVLHQVR